MGASNFMTRISRPISTSILVDTIAKRDQ